MSNLSKLPDQKRLNITLSKEVVENLPNVDLIPHDYKKKIYIIKQFKLIKYA